MNDAPNPIQVQKFLGGVDYPADKSTLLDAARDEGADDNVLQALEALPDQTFDSPTDVSSRIGH